MVMQLGRKTGSGTAIKLEAGVELRVEGNVAYCSRLFYYVSDTAICAPPSLSLCVCPFVLMHISLCSFCLRGGTRCRRCSSIVHPTLRMVSLFRSISDLIHVSCLCNTRCGILRSYVLLGGRREGGVLNLRAVRKYFAVKIQAHSLRDCRTA